MYSCSMVHCANDVAKFSTFQGELSESAVEHFIQIQTGEFAYAQMLIYIYAGEGSWDLVLFH